MVGQGFTLKITTYFSIVSKILCFPIFAAIQEYFFIYLLGNVYFVHDLKFLIPGSLG